MKHEWALTLEIPLTDKEVHKLAEGGKISLRNPAAHFSSDCVSCNVCGAKYVELDTDCVGYWNE